MISIVLCNWRSRAFVWRCIDSIRSQSSGEWELIVVDNASQDGTLERMRSLRDEGVIGTIVELDTNRGYAGGMNAGIAHARGALVVPLNTDVLLATNFVSSMLALHASQDAAGSDTGIYACPVYVWLWSDAAGAPVDEPTAELFTVGASLVRRLTVSAWHPALDPVETLFTGDGSCPVFTRRAIETAASFAGHVYDDEYFAYGEDIDLALRLHALGFRCAANLDTAAWHIGSATAPGFAFTAKPLDTQATAHLNRTRSFARLSMPLKHGRMLPWMLLDDLARIGTVANRLGFVRALLRNYVQADAGNDGPDYPRTDYRFAGSIESASGRRRRRGARLPALHADPLTLLSIGENG